MKVLLHMSHFFFLQIEEENHQLKQKVASLQTQHVGQAKTLSEVQERCQLLEAQLLLYQEDFKTERSDRERAQSKNADLEMQLAELQRQLVGVLACSSGLNFNRLRYE